MNDQERAERDALQLLGRKLLRTTVSLVRTDELGRGSGFVIPWDSDIRVVTARHVVGIGEWAVEVKPNRDIEAELSNIPIEKRETLLLRLVTDQHSLAASTHDIAWAKLDVDVSTIVRDTSLPVYKGPLDVLPNESEIYTFAAPNRDEWHRDAHVILREVAAEAYMTYCGECTTGLRFRLARDHQGDAYYRGSSGAPVADRSGAIVGVLTAAGKEKNELLVASLAPFIRAMRWTVYE